MFTTNRRIVGNIKLQTSLLVVPLLLFTAVLLGLVYGYEWDKRHTPIDNLPLDSSFKANVIYVDYPATNLILVASWSSTVAVQLIGSLLTLTSYIMAADLIWSSQQSFHALLPTPQQLGTLTDLLDAKKWTMLVWLSAFWRKGPKQAKSRWILEFPAVIQLAGLGLSVAIIACDTWLHVATKSVTRTYLAEISNTSASGPAYWFSEYLRPDCQQDSDPCSVKEENGRLVAAYPLEIGGLLQQNSVDTEIIPGPGSSPDGSHMLAPRLAQSEDLKVTSAMNFQNFTASAFSVTASCSTDDRSQENICTFPDRPNATTSWNISCNGGFETTLSEASWLHIGTQSLDDSTPSSVSSLIDVSLAMFLERRNLSSWPMQTLAWRNPQLNDTVVGVLLTTTCTLRLAQATYSWTNVTLNQNSAQGSTPNDTAAGIVRSLIGDAGFFNANNTDNLQNIRLNAFQQGLGLTISQAPNGTVDGDSFRKALEDSLAYVGIALLGGTFEAGPAISLQLGNSTIVTQVGKAPLFTLVILNIWYACFGLLLALLASYILLRSESSEGIVAVKQLLTVDGLARAAVVKYRGDLSGETSDLRIGVEKVDGKWQFRAWNVSDEEHESKALLTEEEREDVGSIRTAQSKTSDEDERRDLVHRQT